MKITLDVDSILYEYLLTKYSEKKLKKVLGNQLERAIQFEGRCPVCKEGVLTVIPKNNHLMTCSGGCGTTGFVLPKDVTVDTKDLSVYKIKTFRIALANNEKGRKKIYWYLKRAKGSE